MTATTAVLASCPTCGWAATGEQPTVARLVAFHERKWGHDMTVTGGYDFAAVVGATGSYFDGAVTA